MSGWLRGAAAAIMRSTRIGVREGKKVSGTNLSLSLSFLCLSSRGGGRRRHLMVLGPRLGSSLSPSMRVGAGVSDGSRLSGCSQVRAGLEGLGWPSLVIPVARGNCVWHGC